MATCIQKLYNRHHPTRKVFVYPTRHIVHRPNIRKPCRCCRKQIHVVKPPGKTAQSVQTSTMDDFALDSKPLTVNLNLNLLKPPDVFNDIENVISEDTGITPFPVETVSVYNGNQRTVDHIEKSLENLTRQLFALKNRQNPPLVSPTYSYKQTSYNCYNLGHGEVNDKQWDYADSAIPNVGGHGHPLCFQNDENSTANQMQLKNRQNTNESNNHVEAHRQCTGKRDNTVLNSNYVPEKPALQYIGQAETPDRVIYGNVIYKKVDVLGSENQACNSANCTKFIRNDVMRSSTMKSITNKRPTVDGFNDPYLETNTGIIGEKAPTSAHEKDLEEVSSSEKFSPTKPFMEMKWKPYYTCKRGPNSTCLPTAFLDFPPPPPIKFDGSREFSAITNMPPPLPLSGATSSLGNPGSMPSVLSRNPFYVDNPPIFSEIIPVHRPIHKQDYKRHPQTAGLKPSEIQYFSKKLEKLEKELESASSAATSHFENILNGEKRNSNETVNSQSHKRSTLGQMIKEKVKEVIKHKPQ